MDLPVRRWGHGTASRQAVLLHGLTSSAATWWRIAAGLAEAGWSVTAPDLRGHGDAPRAPSYRIDEMAADVAALAPAGGWDLLVGHSLGGAVGAQLASAHPHLVRSLALLDPVITLDPGITEAVRQSVQAELEWTEDEVIGNHPAWDREDVRLKVEAAKSTSPEVVAGVFGHNRPWALEPQAAGVTMPTVVLGAEHDASFSPAEGERLTAANPLIRYLLVPGAGHSVHRDRPEAVLQELV